MSISEEPAFPFEGGNNNGIQPFIGMTKREYFAVMAMQALLSATKRDGVWAGINAGAAEQAVIEADALIKALEGID